MVWLDEQWNVPSRSDHYVMQLTRWTQAIYRLLAGTKTPPVDTLLEFKHQPAVPAISQEALRQQQNEAAKNRWAMWMGKKHE